MKIAIVGAGISGLSLAHALLEKNHGLDVTIFEAEYHPGGKIWTERIDGFLCESGTNGFLDNRPKTLELLSKLSLTPMRSNDNARKRYIYSDKRLRLIPESPIAFLRSNLLSASGKLRIIAELFVPQKDATDETLESFAVRRLGREAFEKLIDPMASGIYAGDPSRMSLKSCFPKIYELEKNYGGLIRGMLKMKREAKKTGRKVGPGPGGILTSCDGGMYTLIDSLKGLLGERLQLGREVKSIGKKGDLYTIHLGDGSTCESECVVLASPAYASAEMLVEMDKEIAGLMSDIPYPPVSVVCLGFRGGKISRGLNGFGFLVPAKERREIMGTLYDSSIFPNRAPEGYALLRTIVGGARAAKVALLNDERLLSTVMVELSEIMGLKAEPDFVKIFRHEKAIPQYTARHDKNLDQIDRSIARHKRLFLAGNAYRGIGVNDCIENSLKLADYIAQLTSCLQAPAL
ncbi:protoporphyrinogen oxidase [Thermodesulfovibrionales bacterium]|nr:protoporphyrinogen oxidase [Thermodesulfovibrionales bacterium]